MSAKAEQTSSPMNEIALLADIPVRISVEVAQTALSIGELLELKPGAVLELERPAGDPGDVRINGRYVARGDILAVGEASGVKITEILRPEAGPGARP
jgi:flagellar motor switch protein FliN/FliY